MLITVTALLQDCLFLNNSAPVDVKGRLLDKKQTRGCDFVLFFFNLFSVFWLRPGLWTWCSASWPAGSVVLFSNLAAPEQEIGFLVPSILMDS